MSARNRREGRRGAGDNQRARGTNPRSIGTNPRALRTNPHPGKSELTGQWRAVFRRIGRMAPDVQHAALRNIEREWSALPLALRDELRTPVEQLADELGRSLRID